MIKSPKTIERILQDIAGLLMEVGPEAFRDRQDRELLSINAHVVDAKLVINLRSWSEEEDNSSDLNNPTEIHLVLTLTDSWARELKYTREEASTYVPYGNQSVPLPPELVLDSIEELD